MDISNLSYADRQKMVNLIEQKQVKDFMQLYSNLVDRCFNDCINDFTSKAVSGKEEKCVSKCTEKFLKHSERAGLRFAEQNYLLQQQQQPPPS